MSSKPHGLFDCRCTSCGTVFKTQRHMAGRKTACPSCQAVIVIPPMASEEELSGEQRKPFWHECAKCGSILQSLAEGGTVDKCPVCATPFRVPMTSEDIARRRAEQERLLQEQEAAELRRQQEEQAQRQAQEAQRQAQIAQQRLQRHREHLQMLRREAALDCGSLAVSEALHFEDIRMDKLCRQGCDLLGQIRRNHDELPHLQDLMGRIDPDLERGRLAQTRQRLRQLQDLIARDTQTLKDAQVALGEMILKTRIMPEKFGLFFQRLDSPQEETAEEAADEVLPIADDAQASQPAGPLWYCQCRGQQFGPVGEDQIFQWIAEKRLAPTDLVWTDGMADWAPILNTPPFGG
ncbi:MAG: GYF domain-containing protein [Planctomycetaceae bacterium]|nr:GYF domain-containing protein [Planctomycetaceae bacterium]